jgi:hypothetical protein
MTHKKSQSVERFGSFYGSTTTLPGIETLTAFGGY